MAAGSASLLQGGVGDDGGAGGGGDGRGGDGVNDGAFGGTPTRSRPEQFWNASPQAMSEQETQAGELESARQSVRQFFTTQ